MPEITNYFPEHQEDSNVILPALACIAISVLLVQFMSSLSSNHANISGLDFSGLLFVSSYLAILGLWTAFWVDKLNLLELLWVCLYISPVVGYFLCNSLSQEKCAVGGYFHATKASSAESKKSK
jgi:hypothetical protein